MLVASGLVRRRTSYADRSPLDDQKMIRPMYHENRVLSVSDACPRFMPPFHVRCTGHLSDERLCFPVELCLLTFLEIDQFESKVMDRSTIEGTADHLALHLADVGVCSTRSSAVTEFSMPGVFADYRGSQYEF